MIPDMRDDMTTAEAEAWADGWRAAREAAASAAKRTGSYTCPEYGPMTNGLALEIAHAIRALAPPAPPARTRLGILGEG